MLDAFVHNPTKLAFAALALLVLTPLSSRWFAKDRVEVRFAILLMFFGGVAAAVYAIDSPSAPTKNPVDTGKSGEVSSSPENHPVSMPIPKKIPDNNDKESIFYKDGLNKVSEFQAPQMPNIEKNPEEILFGEWVRIDDAQDKFCGLFVTKPGGGDSYRGWATARIICRNGEVWNFVKNGIDGGWLKQVSTKNGVNVYPEWRDENNDGLKDYCRAVGNRYPINESYEACSLAPTFTRIKVLQ